MLPKLEWFSEIFNVQRLHLMSLLIMAGLKLQNRAAGCVVCARPHSQSAERIYFPLLNPLQSRAIYARDADAPYKTALYELLLARIPTTFTRHPFSVSLLIFCHLQPNECSLKVPVMFPIKAGERRGRRGKTGCFPDKQRQIRARQRHQDQTNNFKS